MSQPIATNKKAYRDYFFSETWECGIALTGGEVKSIRAGQVNFKDSFATMNGGEVFLYNLHINPYEFSASFMDEKADRIRKLLLHKKEIKKISGLVSQKKMALIPTKIYFNNRGLVKVELAAGRGKKLYDKRETIKKRELKRSLQRVVKDRVG